MSAAAPLGSPRRRPPIGRWIASLALVAIVLVAAVVVLRPTSPLANWTSEPTVPGAELAESTVDACREWAARRRPAAPEMEAMAELPVVAQEQRGPVSVALFADEEGRAASVCSIIPVVGKPAYVELSGAVDISPEDLGRISVWVAASGANWDYGSRWEVTGRVAADVHEVTIVLRDGQRVTATIDDGWFLAWWPSHSEPVRFELSGSGDASVESIDLGDRYDHGEPPCRIVLFDAFCVWTY